MDRNKLAICEWSSPVMGPGICEVVSEAGLRGVELDIGSFDRALPLTEAETREYYRRSAERFGITYTAVALNCFGKYTLLHPEDKEESAVSRKILRAGIDIAADLKIPVVQVPAFFDSGMKNDADIHASAGFLQEACDYARNLGVRIASENTLDLRGNQELIRSVDRSNFGIYFDTENPVFFRCGDPVEMILALNEKIAEVHVKDGSDERIASKLLGTGHTRFAECIGALKEIGYDGWLVIENNYHEFFREMPFTGRYDLLRKDVQTIIEAIG